MILCDTEQWREFCVAWQREQCRWVPSSLSPESNHIWISKQPVYCPRSVLGSSKHCFLDLGSGRRHEVLLSSIKPVYFHRSWRGWFSCLCQSLCWIIASSCPPPSFSPLAGAVPVALLSPWHSCFSILLKLVHRSAPWLARYRRYLSKRKMLPLL